MGVEITTGLLWTWLSCLTALYVGIYLCWWIKVEGDQAWAVHQRREQLRLRMDRINTAFRKISQQMVALRTEEIGLVLRQLEKQMAKIGRYGGDRSSAPHRRPAATPNYNDTKE